MKARLALALSVLALVGCGGAGSGETVLRIVTWRPDAREVWDRLQREFERDHPGVRVVREEAPNNSDQFHALLTQKLRNRDASVDAFLMDVVWTSEFARAGWALPLDDRFPAGERAAFFPGVIEADTVGGRLYAVALNTDAGVLYYRKDLLDRHGLRPPRTWQEMLEEIATITAAERDPHLHGYSGQFKQYEGLVCDMLEFVASNGGDLMEPASPATLGAVRFVRDRIIGRAAPRGVLTYQEQESLDLFASGGAVFHRNWPYAWSVLRGTDLSGRVAIAKLPAFPGGRSASALGGWRFGLSAFSRHPDLAWELVRRLTSAEAQKAFAVAAGKAPARRALYDDPDVLSANPHFAALRPVFETAVPRPRTPVYPRVSHALQRFLHAAISEPDSDLDALAREAAGEIEDARASVAAGTAP